LKLAHRSLSKKRVRRAAAGAFGAGEVMIAVSAMSV